MARNVQGVVGNGQSGGGPIANLSRNRGVGLGRYEGAAPRCEVGQSTHRLPSLVKYVFDVVTVPTRPPRRLTARRHIGRTERAIPRTRVSTEWTAGACRSSSTALRAH
jgi:hypothetical protein